MAVLAISMMALTSCGGSDAKSTGSDSTKTEKEATEQAAPEQAAPEQAAPAQNLGEPENGVIMYTGNEEIKPAALPIVIDFNAPWCGPCHKFVPTFHKVAQDLQGKAIFMEVDIDANPVTKDQLVGSDDIPQVTVLMPDGSTPVVKKGLMKEDEFRELIAPYVK